MSMPPQNPIEAVTCLDPYPYYTALVVSRPIYRDEVTGFWIASSAAAVTAVLNSDLCRVRPPTETVPRALLGSPAAHIFRHLVRMNEGQGHDSMKQAVSSTLQALDEINVAEKSYTWAKFLADELELEIHPCRLSDFAFQLPVYVMAHLLGIAQEQLQQTAQWMSQFVWCLASVSTSEQIEQGKEAANSLLQLFHATLSAQEAGGTDGLLHILACEARLDGCTDIDVVIANAIGLLWQPYEATAGLIGNTLLVLAVHQDVYDHVLAHPDVLNLVLQEVLRYDPPIQNTRRFVAANGIIAGEKMKGGDIVLVVLAAANRDPSVNRDPEQFDIFRKDRHLFTFGAGVHACPGELLARTIARVGIEQLMASGVNMRHLGEMVRYRASTNVRIPLFEGGER